MKSGLKLQYTYNVVSNQQHFGVVALQTDFKSSFNAYLGGSISYHPLPISITHTGNKHYTQKVFMGSDNIQ